MQHAAFVPIEPINVHGKFEFCSFTCARDNRGYPKKMGSPWSGYAHAPFSQKFLWTFVQMDPLNVLAKFEIRRICSP